MVGVSSFVRSIRYDPDFIAYDTLEAAGAETFRLVRTPLRVTANGRPLARLDAPDRPSWTYNRNTGVLRVRRDGATRVRIDLTGGGAPPPVEPAAVPILGSAAQGTFSDTLWDGGPWINATRCRAESNGVIRLVRARVGAIAGHYAAAVYADAGGSPGPLLRRAGATAAPAAGWRAMALESPLKVVAGRNYWLAIWSDDPAARVDAVTGGATRWGRYDFGSWPDPLATSGGGAIRYSIYAAGQ